MFRDVGCAEIYEGIGEAGVEFRSFAKLCDFCINLMLLARLQACAHVVRRRIGGCGLRCKPCKQEKLNHEVSGSRTSRNWSARTSLRTSLAPQGQRTSPPAFST